MTIIRCVISPAAGRANGTCRRATIVPGAIDLGSRRGTTGDQNNPWFAIGRGGEWNEAHGDVWFGALAWSGSWRIRIDQDVLHQVRVTGGFNPFDFSYRLAPGKSLQTPVFYAGYTPGGIGEASRLMHRFELTRILPGAPKPKLRPVLYNSWEATEFKVTEAQQEQLAEHAAKLGVERFVIDDGWFGARNSDHAGLGDWTVNRTKFPNGLKPLIDKVHGLGMSFGLWVEPEMVNPDSDLYRAHPDWVFNFTGRPRTEGRNQLVLNLARKDVADHVYTTLDRLLSKNDIQFLKWDYNRNWTEPGWPAVAPDEQQKVYVAFIDNLYDIIRRLRAKHPGRGDRVVLRRRRPGGSGHHGADRRGVAVGQHRPVRPPLDPGRFHLCLYAGRDDGLGDRFAELGQQPQQLARLPLPVLDAGRARHRREHPRLERQGRRHGKPLRRQYKRIRETVQRGLTVPVAVAARQVATLGHRKRGRRRPRGGAVCLPTHGPKAEPYPTLRLHGLDPKAQLSLSPDPRRGGARARRPKPAAPTGCIVAST